MNPHTVIFIGPQGSGKGTQIEKVKARLTELDPERVVVDVQSGKAFRRFAEVGQGYAADQVRATLDTGALQPLFLSVTLWGELMIGKVDQDCHLLIDGFPRTIPQATVLESALAFYNRAPLSIVYLNTPEDVVRKRMKERARSDDTDASIEARLQWYEHETLHVIEYYRSREDTNLITIDGTLSIDGVYAEICKGLGI